MRTATGRLLALVIVLGGIGLCAKGPDGSSAHFVVLNDFKELGKTNAGTVFKLVGPLLNPTLTVAKTLGTGGQAGSLGDEQDVVIIQHGKDVCIYLTDAETADIAAFIYPTFAAVGRYTLAGVTNSGFGLGLAAHGNFLFASYSQSSDPLFFIATWKIESGCGLALATTFDVSGDVNGMTISSDGKTLVAGYAYPFPSVDSFSVAADGTLTEHGPYGGPFSSPGGVDITADSKYAIFAEFNGGIQSEVQIGIYAINSDGSLGTNNTFSNLGPSTNAGYIWLSPNEKFLFVSGQGRGSPIVTLNFDESVPQVTYAGCSVNVKGAPYGLATVLPTGSGGLLYAGESTGPADVALFEIDSSTGCLTEVPGSPFSSGEKGAGASVAAWPPRPF